MKRIKGCAFVTKEISGDYLRSSFKGGEGGAAFAIESFHLLWSTFESGEGGAAAAKEIFSDLLWSSFKGG
jgi:hypothetical protein